MLWPVPASLRRVMPPTKIQGRPTTRTPPPHGEIRSNFCKEPSCLNFGVPMPERAEAARIARVAKAAKAAHAAAIAAVVASGGTASPFPGVRGHYAVKSGGADPMALCRVCGASFPFKNDRAIAEERDRLTARLREPPSVGCPDSACPNASVPVGTPGAWASYGKTKAGSPRWRCGACGRTVSESARTTLRQKHPSRNRLIFKLLLAKTPFARIADVVETDQSTVQHRFGFIHGRCVAFASRRERKLAEMEFPRLRVAVDRLDLAMNWRSRHDRKNVVLSAVASVEERTGYCFGLHLNFDPGTNVSEAEDEALALDDASKPSAWRRHARIWLTDDYVRAAAKREGLRSRTKPRNVARIPLRGLGREIEETYSEALGRDDVESPDEPDDDRRLPELGAQVRLEYALHGHFHYLRALLPNVGKWRFFLDQDSGMRAACLGTFHREISARTCDAFYVRIAKEMTIDEKRRSCAAAGKAFAAAKAARPGLSDRDAVAALLRQRLAAMTTRGPWRDRWLSHPLPTMSEPEKAVCWLTPDPSMDLDHVAMLHAGASLHAVDALFNQIRRRVSMFERPIVSAHGNRTWSGYAFYRPTHAVWMLEILRVWHNFVFVGKDGKTAAMRLGLARAPIDYGDIIHFVERAG